MMETARWIVFNQGEELEFAECEHCGRECEPAPVLKLGYFDTCPGCRRLMIGTVTAEEIDAGKGV